MGERRPSIAVRLDALVRTIAALAGTLPAAVLAGAAVAAYLPVDASLRFAIGFFSVIPVWVAAMVLTFLIRRGWLALLLWVAVTVALALVVPAAAFWPTLP